MFFKKKKYDVFGSVENNKEKSKTTEKYLNEINNKETISPSIMRMSKYDVLDEGLTMYDTGMISPTTYAQLIELIDTTDKNVGTNNNKISTTFPVTTNNVKKERDD